MCGIIGIVSQSTPASPVILEGLKRLEYRGYDSAGIATLAPAANGGSEWGRITRRRAEGKIARLEALLTEQPLQGAVGIGHTRWATHGIPNESNAHPHATEKVAVVHNGIIENYMELRRELETTGHRFTSQTDTEVIPVLITRYLNEGMKPAEAIHATIKRLHGAYALTVICTDAPNRIYAARHGAPLAIGYGKNLMLVGSDALALTGQADYITYLEDGDWAEISATSAAIYDFQGMAVDRTRHAFTYSTAAAAKGNYRHYMQKEIFEQPAVVGDTLTSYYNPSTQKIALPDLGVDLSAISRIQLVACGTSYYAALAASYWFEQIARIPAQVEIASEFRYREPILDKNGMSIVISQSGETADTLAALRYIIKQQPCIAIVNVPMSSIARAATSVIPTHAGPEIGVASTKAFTTQLMALACLALAIAEAKGTLNPEQLKTHTRELLSVPELMSDILSLDSHIEQIAHHIADARDVLYLGRGTSYAIAHEGALKLKELSYIHAEAYAAGEMKHGPIALIDEHVPIIALAPSDALFEKTASNLQEAAARGGRLIVLTDAKGAPTYTAIAEAMLTLPDTTPFTAPMLYALPVQMLAYHTAVIKGTDVDQPRNLAKSVTVE